MSEDAMRILKAEEGFSKTPYWDYAQWTVGYGTKCPDDKLEYYKKNGITEEEAELLLRTYVDRFEQDLKKFMNRTGVALNQNQFDALVSFAFNCGVANLKKSTLIKRVLHDPSDARISFEFSRWVYSNGRFLAGLARRRTAESTLYFSPVKEVEVEPETGGENE
jgi:lysozyme